MQSVDRPVGPNSNFVHEFLRHLALSGFNGSPKFFGTDERGREILSFVEGDVPPELGYYSDGDLVKAAQLIRRFHEHSRSFPRKGPHEIVCHNNLSPCNFVFRDGPIAIIDFDAAAWLAPWDVSYAAWLWLDIGNEDYSPYHQARRIRLFCEAYGCDARELMDCMILRQKDHTLRIEKRIPALQNGERRV